MRGFKSALLIAAASMPAIPQSIGAFSEEVKVEYVLVVDHIPAQFIEIEIAPANSKRVTVAGGYVLQIERDEDALSMNSELRTEAGRILHSRRTSVDDGTVRSVAYLICGDSVVHFSPIPAVLPKCVEGEH